MIKDYRIRKILVFFTTPILVAGLTFSNPLSNVVYATGETTTTEDEEAKKKAEEEKKKNETINSIKDSIKEKESAIADAKKERNTLSSGKSNIEKIRNELQKNKSDLSAYVSELDAQVAEIETKIEGLKTQITEKEAEIEQTKKDLDEAIKIRDKQYENMKKRVQALYEQGDTFYLEILLNSGGISDFLNQMDYVDDLSKYDEKMFKEYAETVEYVKVCQAELEEEEALLQETKQAAEDEQKTCETLIAEKQAEIAAVQEQINDKDKVIKEYEQEIAEMNASITELEKIVAQERKQLENMRVYDGGVFCWPAPSYTRVSSDYGYRIHPTLKVEMFHNGVDLAAPGGSDILAAYDGEVVSASYTAAMGNYIMIDHGGGLYTIYMHASKLLVSEGQEVKRGEKIALVGSTGRSTGNHLHFTVRKNGEYVSPWNYITKP